jgi:beta-propeller uncharacterized protein DUF5122
MASPGDLDTSFAGDGKKTINFGGVDTANVVLVQPNGRIVVAGSTAKVTTAPSRFCVARLRSNGTLDTAFGSAASVLSASAATASASLSSARRCSRMARSCSREARICGPPSRA